MFNTKKRIEELEEELRVLKDVVLRQQNEIDELKEKKKKSVYMG